jgi:hypothetical protein
MGIGFVWWLLLISIWGKSSSRQESLLVVVEVLVEVWICVMVFVNWRMLANLHSQTVVNVSAMRTVVVITVVTVAVTLRYVVAVTPEEASCQHWSRASMHDTHCWYW